MKTLEQAKSEMLLLARRYGYNDESSLEFFCVHDDERFVLAKSGEVLVEWIDERPVFVGSRI